MDAPEICIDFAREAISVTPTEQLDYGMLAIRLGCGPCEQSVDLVAAAEASEVVPALRSAGISFHVRGRTSLGTEASWKVSRSGCSGAACPSVESIQDIRDMLVDGQKAAS